MMELKDILTFANLICVAAAHAGHEQKPIAGPHKSLWYNALPGDGGTQAFHPLYKRCPL